MVPERAARHRLVRLRLALRSGGRARPVRRRARDCRHTWGSAAKLFADHIENANLGPFEAVRTTGAGRFASILYALVPDILPVLLSTALYLWEFNIRASTVLGIVGAGGIGQELKNSMDLLDFARLFTIIAVILVVVTTLDQLSSWLRRRLI